MKIWKLSHGKGITDEEYATALSKNIVMIDSNTNGMLGNQVTQAMNFKDAKKGDIFYLCRSNEKIELLAEFINDNVTETENGWYQREYKIVAKSVKIMSYDGEKKWWTPNNNSTFIEIPPSEFEQFVDFILKPFFDIDSLDKPKDTRSKIMPLNQILYGPPGTGKTYNTIANALSIVEGKSIEDLKAEARAELKKRFDSYIELGQIVFTTFHQSYGYEEFVEGIKPIPAGKDGNEDGTEMIYTVADGIFKKICKEAKKITYKTDNIAVDSNNAVWKISLGGAGNWHNVKNQCFQNSEIRIGWAQVKQLGDNEFTKLETKTQNTITSFMETMAIGDIVLSLYSATEIDGIGIIDGDYERDEQNNEEYPHKRKVKWLTSGEVIDILGFNQKTRLVQQTVYRLWRINPSDLAPIIPINKYKIEINNVDKNYILIIDEINRGNISKIFGELITLIEDSKRLDKPEELKAKLPYSGDEFSVPQNLYIIGTMNTADRSIALMDTALRRRFEFVEMMPEYTELNFEISGVNIGEMLKKINERIEFLCDRDHQIGHAYFMGIKEFDELQSVFKNKIIPLLQEYFYDDWEKIRLVLADNQTKEQKYQFVKIKAEMKQEKIKELFGNKYNGNGFEFDEEKKIFEINESALKEPNSYVKIYSNIKGGQDADNQSKG